MAAVQSSDDHSLLAFIERNHEAILMDWEQFARSIVSARHLDPAALRDHADGILHDIASDLKLAQTPLQQAEKAQGRQPHGSQRSQAELHGAERVALGFSVSDTVSEFRALRASVLKLWGEAELSASEVVSGELSRFNEAIDQALAESIVTYSARADQSRELFLAILGHDLRAPLSTMALAGDLLMRPGLPPAQIPIVGARVRRSARLMGAMVEDLLGFTRTQLGSGMPTCLAPIDVRTVCEAAIEDAGATHPGTRFELKLSDNLKGTFDSVRLHQLFTNLLVNAAQYGAKGHPVVLEAHREADAVVVQATNHGPPIPEASWRSIFKPLIQLPAGDDDTRPKTSLGLGLFVAREIALAHGGSIEVKSNDAEGTTFTVRLPVPTQAVVH